MAVRWGRRPLHPLVLTALAAASLVAVAAAGPARRGEQELQARQVQASQLMAHGMAGIRAARLRRGPLNLRADPNGTGLIGPASSHITTSVGVLAAKRTATNPNWGAAMARMLWEAGVRPGDAVAMGFSGSFPGLNLAALSAAWALDLIPLVITALGASNWGANDPQFTWLDMETALKDVGFPTRSLAASIGGVQDRGLDLLPEGRAVLRAAVAHHGVRLIAGSSLEAIVRARLALYDQGARGGQITAFVSVGGAQANLGTCEEAFLGSPGLIRSLPPCPQAQQGVAHHFLRRGIPVINALNIQTLALRYGLPVDPIPLPRPGEGGVYVFGRTYRPVLVLILFLLLLGAALRWPRSRMP